MKQSFKKTVSMLIAVVMLSQPIFAMETFNSRDEVPERYKWDLTHFYETQDDWEQDIKLLEDKLIPQLAGYQGKLGDSNTLLECLDVRAEALMIGDRASSYAQLMSLQDLSDQEAQVLNGRAAVSSQMLAKTLSYIAPELSKFDNEVILGYINDPRFEDYTSMFEYILKQKPHILSESEEGLLARLNAFKGAPENIYTVLSSVDLKIPDIEDADGNTIKITDGNYSVLLHDTDRDFRKLVSDSYLTTYMELNNTFAAIYAAEVEKNVFLSMAKNYTSALEAATEPNDIPTSVYENLIISASNGVAPLSKYFTLRKNALGIDKVRRYDMFVSLIPGQDKTFGYDEAQELVLDALEPLGEEYIAKLETAFNENWIDVYETPNKYNGAFCMGVFDPHPYVLLNYNGSVMEVSTIAHELGHAMHNVYTNLVQPLDNMERPTFTTEVAAIVNEILFDNYMIENAETNSDKLFYVNNMVQLYYSTFYVQALYAEFEKSTHDIVESGGILTGAALNGIWSDLCSKYYGESYEADELNSVGWSRIPHFYRNFYVYQYATSIAAANRIATAILNQKPGFLDKYYEFLSSGSKYSPIDTLAIVDIDMNSSEVIEDFVNEFDMLVDELENLMKLEGIIEGDSSIKID